jgi:hypothetical protein
VGSRSIRAASSTSRTLAPSRSISARMRSAYTCAFWGSVTRPSASISAIARTPATGVFISCDTAATKSACMRCARRLRASARIVAPAPNAYTASTPASRSHGPRPPVGPGSGTA